MKTRSDKKFEIKIFLPKQNKLIIQKNCMTHHLSVMFVAEEYLKFAMDKYRREEINNIIYSLTPSQTNNTKNLVTISTRVTDHYWQALGSFAINNGVSISKVASCLFNHGLSTSKLYEIMESNGYTFKYNKNLSERKRV